MKKLKTWLLERFLPAWAKDGVYQENRRLRTQLERQRQEIDRLNMEEYHDLINKGYERRLQVFNRYWARHCKRLESGWIYNRIFKKFWWPKTEGHPESGCWINSDYSGRDYRYPPQLKEETP